jgi:hypothetical protein
MTSLEKGVPTLKVETSVCKEGEKLSAEKARLLLMLGYMQAVRFAIARRLRLESGTLICPYLPVIFRPSE